MRRARAAALLERTGLGRLLRRLPLWHGVVVLGYHRIGDPAGSELDHGVFSATEDAFDAQLELLSTNFDVIGLDELEAAAGRRGRAVLITFDDGYRDQLDPAARMLAARRMPAAFFLTTGFLDGHGHAWWDEIAWIVRASPRTGIPSDGRWLARPVSFTPGDRESAVRALLDRYRELPGEDGEAFLDHVAQAAGVARPDPSTARWMTWDGARELERLGHRVGGHTVTHPILSRLAGDGQRREIGDCLRRLRHELAGPVDSFAYPSGHLGSHDEETAALLREHGVRWAFSFRGGWQRPGRVAAYDVRRIGVFADHPTPLVAATVSLPFLLGRERR
ncbi:MAG TPA: polysaccharide deacetylase family protein [Thermoleophilaceae bacterium]|jgi:peptidoglycan/xylan/chitin deacetylase (PgdA/CDA1 family)